MKHNTHSAPGFDPVISLLIVGAIAVATILAPTTGWSTEGDTTQPTEQTAFVDSLPRMISYQRPTYPRRAKIRRIEGVVRVRALVDTVGQVEDAVLHQSSGRKILDREALKAALKCRYRPAIKNGVPTSVWVVYQIEFSIDRESSQNRSEMPEIIGLASVTDSDSQHADGSQPVDIVAELVSHSPPVNSLPTLDTLEVWIKALVDRNGRVGQALILTSSGNSAFDRSAIWAAFRNRYRAAIYRGKPVTSWVAYPVSSLESSSTIMTDQSGVNQQPVPLIAAVSQFPAVSLLVAHPSLEGESSPERDVSAHASSRTLSIGILLLHDTGQRRSSKVSVVLDGGCADGLTPGMKGQVWERTPEKQVLLATAEITDVQAFISAAVLIPRSGKVFTKYHAVTFESARPSDEDCLAMGIEYYDAGLYENALACFERVSRLAESNGLIDHHLQDCRRRCRPAPQRPNTPECESVQRLVPAYLEMVRSAIRLANRSAAQRVLDKIMTVDSTSDAVVELAEALTVLDSCNFSLDDWQTNIADSSLLDRIPSFDFYEVPESPVERVEFERMAAGIANSSSRTVWVKGLVSSGGQVLRAELDESCGLGRLDRAAVRAAYANRFECGLFCGKPVSCWVKWPVEYSPFNPVMGGKSALLLPNPEDDYPSMNEFVAVEVIAEMIHYETPAYPRVAEQGGLGGLVWIKALVGSDGLVKDAVIYRSCGFPLLDDAALASAPKCRFKPALQDDQPVAMWVTWKVDFILENH